LYIPTTTLLSGTGSYTKIQDLLLGADTATFDFTSVAGYTHLELKVSGRMSGAVADDAVTIRFNGDTGANYDWQYDGGFTSTQTTGGTSADTSVRVGEMPGASATAGFVGAITILILDYTSTTLFKAVTCHGFRISTTRLSFSNGGQWRSTSAVTRVTLTPGTGSFLAGSRATLYGLS
jgi:hypothetical protein